MLEKGAGCMGRVILLKASVSAPFCLEEQCKDRHFRLHADMSNHCNCSLPTFLQNWSSSDSPEDSDGGEGHWEGSGAVPSPPGSASSSPSPYLCPRTRAPPSPAARPSSGTCGGSCGRPTFFFLQDSSLDRAEMITVAAMRSSNSKSRMRLKLICKGNVCLSHTSPSPRKRPPSFGCLTQLSFPSPRPKPWATNCFSFVWVLFLVWLIFLSLSISLSHSLFLSPPSTGKLFDI